MSVHVVSKHDNRQHAALKVPAAAQSELSESSVRVRTLLISLTSNNLTYARMGQFLHWYVQVAIRKQTSVPAKRHRIGLIFFIARWDAYPVSKDYPAPYNDSSSWGIVPSWGYATIEETTIPELAKGTVLWGFWPTSSALTDLKLKSGAPNGHWIETSDHRQQLMPLYNRYTVAPTTNSITDLTTEVNPLSEPAQEERDRMAWTALFIGGKAGFILSEYVFSSDPETRPPIHPLGNQPGLHWTLSDGDLSSAVVINLAASTKTARVFSYHVSRKPDSSAPLGLLQVTSSVSRIAEASQNVGTSVPFKAVGYENVGSDETGKWLASRKASKIVIVDFGSRASVLQELLSLIKSRPDLQSCKVVIVQVGNEQKVYSGEEILAGRAKIAELGKVQYNTSGVQDTVLESMDQEAYFTTQKKFWEQWLDRRQLNAPGMEIVMGSGVSGTDGVEGGWERLCHGEVRPEEGLVYKMQ
jgi:hypothetical protein